MGVQTHVFPKNTLSASWTEVNTESDNIAGMDRSVQLDDCEVRCILWDCVLGLRIPWDCGPALVARVDRRL